jgi:DNA modification methylase
MAMTMTDVHSLADLKPDPKNRRKHNPRNIGMIRDALGQVGAARSIVIDEDNVVLAGNGVIEAAADAGIERVQVVDADGETIIAVRRAGLTEEQKRKLALYDNRAAELAEWDTAQLVADLEEGLDFEGVFREDELQAILEQAADDLLKGNAEPPEAQVDRAEELRGKWQTERGQVWEIPSKTVAGKCHRLMCGDSTSAEDVERLMAGEKAALLCTDPPYNVGITYGEQVDDRKALEEYEAFTRSWFGVWQAASERQIVTPGCNNLACWLRWFDPYHVAPWTKTNAMTNGKVARWWCWEPILFFGDKWKRTRPNDVFDFAVPPQKAEGMGSLSPYHPCPKPVPMWVDLLTNYSEPGDIVSDAFDGSGTTLVAAEQTERTGYAMELEPKYVAVALERMTGMGLEPRLTE